MDLDFVHLDSLRSFGIHLSDFAEVPAGSFTMGSVQGGKGEGPVHRVRLTRAFMLQKTPVTQAQWREVTGKKPSRISGDERHPVEGVSWEDVQDFIQLINEKFGARAFRLPTEGEWEYACRAGREEDRTGGGAIQEQAWVMENSGGMSHPVGEKQANPWGLHDMLGNVWEWCQDIYSEEYYPGFDSLDFTDWDALTPEEEAAIVTPEEDPPGPYAGKSRVIRGGSFQSPSHDVCCHRREHLSPQARGVFFVGFRLLLMGER